MSQVTKTELNRLHKELAQLRQQAQSVTAEPIPKLTMNHGEDERLVIGAWRQGREVPENLIITSIFGALPRREFCTRESLLAALPGIKSFHAQLGEGPGEWLPLCLAADINYDGVEAIRAVSGEVYSQ